MKLFGSIIFIILSIAGVVGAFLCGINVLMCLFEQGGSYIAALTGLLMFLIGKIISVFAKLDG